MSASQEQDMAGALAAANALPELLGSFIQAADSLLADALAETYSPASREHVQSVRRQIVASLSAPEVMQSIASGLAALIPESHSPIDDLRLFPQECKAVSPAERWTRLERARLILSNSGLLQAAIDPGRARDLLRSFDTLLGGCVGEPEWGWVEAIANREPAALHQDLPQRQTAASRAEPLTFTELVAIANAWDPWGDPWHRS